MRDNTSHAFCLSVYGCVQGIVRQAVDTRFRDYAISVREAAVDLVGRHVLFRPEFLEQYYPMLADRILVQMGNTHTQTNENRCFIFSLICAL